MINNHDIHSNDNDTEDTDDGNDINFRNIDHNAV